MGYEQLPKWSLVFHFRVSDAESLKHRRKAAYALKERKCNK